MIRFVAIYGRDQTYLESSRSTSQTIADCGIIAAAVVGVVIIDRNTICQDAPTGSVRFALGTCEDETFAARPAARPDNAVASSISYNSESEARGVCLRRYETILRPLNSLFS